MTNDESAKQTHRLLIVDDSYEDRETCRRFLAQSKRNRYIVEEVDTISDALRICVATDLSCVLTDYQLPDGDGLSFLTELIKQQKDTAPPVVMMTGYGSEQVAVTAMKEGAADYLVKGHMTAEAVCRTIYKAIEKAALLRIIRHQQEEKDQIIAELRAALEQVKTLRGIVPICANCKQIRDDKGYWQRVEDYLSNHSDVQFSHGLCPDCVKALYPAVADKILQKMPDVPTVY